MIPFLILETLKKLNLYSDSIKNLLLTIENELLNKGLTKDILRIKEGAYVFIFIVLISVCTDIGGYIFGKLLKGPKITKISPNKTFSGVVGGFIISLIGALVFYEYMPITLSSNFGELISFDFYLFFIKQQ